MDCLQSRRQAVGVSQSSVCVEAERLAHTAGVSGKQEPQVPQFQRIHPRLPARTRVALGWKLHPSPDMSRIVFPPRPPSTPHLVPSTLLYLSLPSLTEPISLLLDCKLLEGDGA